MKKALLSAVCVLLIYFPEAQIYTQTRTCSDIYFSRPSNWATTAWQNTVSDDNTYISTNNLRITSSRPVQFQKFGFSIPTNAVIQGVDVAMIRLKSGRSNVQDAFASLVTGDDFANSGSNTPSQAKSAYWTTSEAGVVYTFPASGTGTDGNPYSWTPGKINKPYFGFFFDIGVSSGSGAVAKIEKLSITVRYTLSTTVSNNLQLTPVDNSVLASANEKGLYNLVVTDMSGRVLQRAVLKDPNNTTVYLNHRLRGVYIISLEGNNSKKVIKTFVR